MVKCIKTYAAHWGIFFKEDKLYRISGTKTKKLDIITDYEKYMYELKNSLKISSVLIGLSKDKKALEEKAKEINYPEIMYNRNMYKMEVEIPFYQIKGEDTVHEFCSLSKEYLEKTHGSSNFDISVKFFEDFFVDLAEIRNEKLNKIISE